MKGIKHTALAAIMATLFAACINDNDDNAGFSSLTGSIGYANTTTGFVAFASFGDWHITQNSGADWCKLKTMSGKGNSIYYIPVTYELNRTGGRRTADFRLSDVHSSDVYVPFSLFQYATRGDGSLGSAPLVKSINGDDGTEITLVYDNLQRPVALKMTKDDATMHDLRITYANDTTINVDNGSSVLRGKHDVGYQPVSLASETDTIGYFTPTRATGAIANGAIGLEMRRKGGERITQTLMLVNQKYGPDDEHKAEKIELTHRRADGTTYTEKMNLRFSVNSNRCQSVDVNQLLTGAENCNPYALLSMFRNMRNSFIISEAVTDNGKYTVETVLNGDKSVRKMTVTNKAGKKVTYTFDY